MPLCVSLSELPERLRADLAWGSRPRLSNVLEACSSRRPRVLQRSGGTFTVALNCTGIVGSLAMATAWIRSSGEHRAESYSTYASRRSSTTVACCTPLTDNSADRTGSTHPCQVIPEMARVTLASLTFEEVPAAVGARPVIQAGASTPTAINRKNNLVLTPCCLRRPDGRAEPISLVSQSMTLVRLNPRRPRTHSCGGRVIIGHGALTPDTHTFRSNFVCPAGARLTMSAVRASGWLLPVWIPGLPMTTFDRSTVSRAPAPMKMPWVFPETMFSSMTLPEPEPITPIPKSSAGSA